MSTEELPMASPSVDLVDGNAVGSAADAAAATDVVGDAHMNGTDLPDVEDLVPADITPQIDQAMLDIDSTAPVLEPAVLDDLAAQAEAEAREVLQDMVDATPIVTADESNGLQAGSVATAPSIISTADASFAPPLQEPVDYRDIPSGLCYDARMRFHSVINPMDDHPEDPRRIYRIYTKLEEAGLVSLPHISQPVDAKTLKRIPVREVDREEVLLVHDLNHWESMLATAHMSYEQLDTLGKISDSVYFNNESAYCARLACGGAIETCKAVVEGRVKNAIAVVRPPGHHCEPDTASGFCLFNNVSVAVKVTMQNHPEVKKVLILDWDVHHGNGTQTAFYDDPNVLFISIHRYENATFYPGSEYGNLDKCGRGAGLGKNINIPWPTKYMGDADYVHAFQKVVMPIAREFDPDLVLSMAFSHISAGFDAAAGDPIGECFVTPAGYAAMTYMLRELSDGKVVAVLEGGYNLDSISVSALAVTKTLMGYAPPRLEDREPSPRAVEAVHRVALEQSKYWRCMAPKAFSGRPSHVTQPVRLHDIVRGHQARALRDKWGLVPLPLLEDRASASFRDQALSTRDFHVSDTLVYFIHEAPDVYSNPSAAADKLSLHETFLADGAMQYIDWALSKKWGLIDINVPSYLSEQLPPVPTSRDAATNGSDAAGDAGTAAPANGVDEKVAEAQPVDELTISSSNGDAAIATAKNGSNSVIGGGDGGGEYTLSPSGTTPNYSVVEETSRLTRYIWDNYIDLTDATNVVLVAAGGDCCAGVVQALSQTAHQHRLQRDGSVRPQSQQIMERCVAVVQFYGAGPLRAVASAEDGLVDWYHAKSICLTTATHECWQGQPKRPKRKFGKVVRAEKAEDMDELMAEMFPFVTERLQEAVLEEVEEEEEDAAAEAESAAPAAAAAVPQAEAEAGDAMAVNGAPTQTADASIAPMDGQQQADRTMAEA